MPRISDMMARTVIPKEDIGKAIMRRVRRRPGWAWTPVDFADLGSRDLIDKKLQRLTKAGELRRIARGLYDRPRHNKLTGKHTVPDYRAVIDAVMRRDQVRMVVDGMTAANDLGLTNAVPAKIVMIVDARLKPIKLGNQQIKFKHAAPSRLFWAGRPGMRVVQALYWLKDILEKGEDEERKVASVLRRLFSHPGHGPAIVKDLKAGLPALPIWMQDFLRDLIIPRESAAPRRSAPSRS
jgi:hypothetical protein